MYHIDMRFQMLTVTQGPKFNQTSRQAETEVCFCKRTPALT